MVAERVVEPGREVDEPGLLDEPPVLVVDPMPRERAGTRELVGRGAVGRDREFERRPRDRRPELDIRLAWDRPWCREAHPTADRLDESHRVRSDLRLVLDVGEVHAGEADRRRPDTDGRGADV